MNINQTKLFPMSVGSKIPYNIYKYVFFIYIYMYTYFNALNKQVFFIAQSVVFQVHCEDRRVWTQNLTPAEVWPLEGVQIPILTRYLVDFRKICIILVVFLSPPKHGCLRCGGILLNHHLGSIVFLSNHLKRI